jgi:hypothetical protein
LNKLGKGRVKNRISDVFSSQMRKCRRVQPNLKT